MLSSSTLALTREEAEELTTELNGVLTRLADEIRDRTPPDGAQRFRVHVDVFPLDGARPPRARRPTPDHVGDGS
jgi:hypothetical protein